MEQLKLIIYGIKDGLFDSISIGACVISTVVRQKNNPQSTQVLKRIRQCCYLSGFLMISMLLFNLILNGLYWAINKMFGSNDIGSTWYWLENLLTYLFSAFWVLPLILLSRIVTALWFQDIAESSFRGRPQPFRSTSQFIADNLFSFLIQLLFLVQANLFCFFPIQSLGQLMNILHLSLLYSLYSFEYKWFNMGRELPRRLDYIELNWPYFFGFGLPLALFTHFLPNYYLSTAFFSFLFPLFILSANETNHRANHEGYKIPFFSFVVWFANKLLSILFKSK